MTQTIVHLVDDVTAGGVMRFLEHLQSLPDVSDGVQYQRIVIEPGRWSAPVLDAAMIVSHLSVSWKNLPMFLALRAKNPGTQIVHIEHSYTAAFMDQHVRYPTRFKTLLRTVYALFDRTIAVSKAQHAWMLENDLVTTRNSGVINPSTDLSPFLKLPIAKGPPRRIGVIGRLEEAKGLDILIQAFRTAAPHDASLSIYGSGGQHEKLFRMSEADPRIKFLGHADPVIAMANCDVIVMPSRREAFGLVALEARAAGRTVLVSGADGLADQAQEGAIQIGMAYSAWHSAMGRLDVLHDPDRLVIARRRAIETANRSLSAWKAMFNEVVVEEPLKLAS